MIKRTGQYLFQRFVGFIIFVAKTGCGRLFCALKSKRQKKNDIYDRIRFEMRRTVLEVC